jgi:hypothetical protein
VSPDMLTGLIIGIAAGVTVLAYTAAWAADRAGERYWERRGPQTIRFTPGPRPVAVPPRPASAPLSAARPPEPCAGRAASVARLRRLLARQGAQRG